MGLMNRVLATQSQSSLLQKAKEVRSKADETPSFAGQDPDTEKKKPSLEYCQVS